MKKIDHRIYYDSKTGEVRFAVLKKMCDFPVEHRLYYAIGERCPCQQEWVDVGLESTEYMSMKNGLLFLDL